LRSGWPGTIPMICLRLRGQTHPGTEPSTAFLYLLRRFSAVFVAEISTRIVVRGFSRCFDILQSASSRFDADASPRFLLALEKGSDLGGASMAPCVSRIPYGTAILPFLSSFGALLENRLYHKQRLSLQGAWGQGAEEEGLPFPVGLFRWSISEVP